MKRFKAWLHTFWVWLSTDKVDLPTIEADMSFGPWSKFERDGRGER